MLGARFCWLLTIRTFIVSTYCGLIHLCTSFVAANSRSNAIKRSSLGDVRILCWFSLSWLKVRPAGCSDIYRRHRLNILKYQLHHLEAVQYLLAGSSDAGWENCWSKNCLVHFVFGRSLPSAISPNRLLVFKDWYATTQKLTCFAVLNSRSRSTFRDTGRLPNAGFAYGRCRQFLLTSHIISYSTRLRATAASINASFVICAVISELVFCKVILMDYPCLTSNRTGLPSWSNQSK